MDDAHHNEKPPSPHHVYAWLLTDADGTESVPVVTSDGLSMPLMGLNAKLASIVTHGIAQNIANKHGQSIRLVRWGGAGETLVRIDPVGSDQE